MRNARIVCLAALASSFLTPAARAAMTMDSAAVGNPANAADPGTGLGAVVQSYLISRHEVTNTRYVEFLNAKAASDPLALYNPNMTNDGRGGITRSGSTGSFTCGRHVRIDEPGASRGVARHRYRTDVYALGVLLYELLSGAKPFDGNRASLRPSSQLGPML